MVSGQVQQKVAIEFYFRISLTRASLLMQFLRQSLFSSEMTETFFGTGLSKHQKS